MRISIEIVVTDREIEPLIDRMTLQNHARWEEGSSYVSVRVNIEMYASASACVRV